MKTAIKILGVVSLLLAQLHATAQTDSLIFSNGKYLVGEISTMERGVLTIGTPYSQTDFRVNWEDITKIFSNVTMIISTTGGQRHYGTMKSDSAGSVTINSKYEGIVTFKLEDIVYIKPIEKTFLDRLGASIDLGYTRTKARNQRQFTIRSRVGFIAERYSASASFNSLATAQDETDDINRTDGNLTYHYFLPKDYFIVGRLDFLQNTEQLLNLRSNYKLGLGKFVFRNNSLYWNFSAGASFNREDFSGTEGDRSGSEIWIGTDLNLFNIGDFSLYSNIFAYSGISESDRIRVDFRTDLRYNLPLDFYIKTGLTLNYDNQPARDASQSDYVWQTTFGWSW